MTFPTLLRHKGMTKPTMTMMNLPTLRPLLLCALLCCAFQITLSGRAAVRPAVLDTLPDDGYDAQAAQDRELEEMRQRYQAYYNHKKAETMAREAVQQGPSHLWEAPPTFEELRENARQELAGELSPKGAATNHKDQAEVRPEVLREQIGQGLGAAPPQWTAKGGQPSETPDEAWERQLRAGLKDSAPPQAERQPANTRYRLAPSSAPSHPQANTADTADPLSLPAELGRNIPLNKLIFEPGTSVLMPDAYAALERVLAFLRANEGSIVEIGAHEPAAELSYAEALKLTEARAQAVVNFLVGHGISTGRLSARGYGHAFPSPAQTQRVEMRIIGEY